MFGSARFLAVLAALTTMIVTTAVSTAEAQVPDRHGFFAYLDGRWMWLGGDQLDGSLGLDAPTTSGPGGQMMIGIKMTPTFDVALAGDVQGLFTELTKFRNGTLSVDTNHQHFDLEAGFSNDYMRFSAGLRGIHYNQTAGYNVPGFSGYDQRDMMGIGPKLGIGGRFALSDSWSLIGGANVALLYTQFTDTGTGVLLNSGTYWGLVPELGGELGVSWRSADSPALSFALGGRIAASFNTSVTADGNHRGTMLEFGPFVRMAYNFSGPRRTTTASQAILSDAPQLPESKDAAIQDLFFSFGSVDLSLVSQAKVRQVADDARHGKRTIIRLRGQADGRTLSPQRAATVRAELTQRGVAASDVALRLDGEALQGRALILIVD